MSERAFEFAPLGAHHDRDAFVCGEEALDRYLKTQATQDIRRRVANCFVATEGNQGRIAGYYTIAAAAIALTALPQEEAKRLPKYPAIPAVRIGRLAVAQNFQGRGLGALLLVDAMRRSLQFPPAVYALVVDAKNEAAARFYEKFGFRPVKDAPLTLFLPMATAGKAFLG
jgi:ribosomal protein S18 acetylase RimI-like enzyme